MSAVLTAPTPTSPWRSALPAVVAAVLAVVLLYLDTFKAMAAIWSRSDTYAHAFLVPPIVAWLVYRRREVLRHVVPVSQPWLLPLALLPVMAWVVGDMAGINTVTHASVVTLLVLTVPVVLGTAVARQLAFPLAFLFFMVPFGDFALPWFMQWTADFTVAALRLLGVPVYREGLAFIIPSGAWSVVEACSGVRYLIASFMVGTLFAYLQYRSLRRRVAFALVSLVVPIVANWVRALMIVLLGHLSNNRIAAGVDHLIYGWVFFGVVIGLMFLIGARWSEPEDDAAAPGTRPPPAARSSVPPWATALGLMALTAMPAIATLGFADRAGASGAPALMAPALTGPVPVERPEAFRPVFSGAAVQQQWVFDAEGTRIAVHVGYFRHQRAGHKLVGWDHGLERQAGDGWRVIGSSLRSVRIGDTSLTLRAAELGSGRLAGSGDRRVQLRQVMWAGGRLTASDGAATWHGVRGRLSGYGDDAAYITFHTEDDDAVRAAEALDRFVARHLGAVVDALEAVRQRR